jgi:hypothetical protein
VRTVTCIFLVALIFNLWGLSQCAKGQTAAKENTVFSTNEFFAKGGLGIIKDDLYISVRSAKNELVLSAGQRWAGLDADKPEVVVFFARRVWPLQDLPKAFDLSNAIVVSFELDKVRFFDFSAMSGGYYKRANLSE